MAALVQDVGLTRADALLGLHDPTAIPSTSLPLHREPLVPVVLPPLPARCARGGHRMTVGATYCVACRALGLWPRLDRRKLGRAAPDLDRIARLAERRSSLHIDTIRGMLMRPPGR